MARSFERQFTDYIKDLTGVVGDLTRKRRLVDLAEEALELILKRTEGLRGQTP